VITPVPPRGLLLAVAIALAGCSQGSGGAVTVAVSATDRQRNSMSETTQTTYAVVADSGPLATGRHVLTLTRSVTVGDQVTDETRFVLLAEGRGSFSSGHYRPLGDERPVYSDWKSEGAAALSPVIVTTVASKPRTDTP
jgi:hypothetical protein